MSDRVRVSFEGLYTQGSINVKSSVVLDSGALFCFTEGRDDVQIEKVVPKPPSRSRSVLLHKATGNVYVLNHSGLWRDAINGATYGDGFFPDDWVERYEVLHDAGKRREN